MRLQSKIPNQRIVHPKCAATQTRLIFHVTLSVVCISVSSSTVATELPVGPITFDSDEDYDSFFKETFPSATSLTRNMAGYLSIEGGLDGVAIFDSSAEDAIGGSGGRRGMDANNDLQDFTISATFGGASTGGFLLRLDDEESNGYYATFNRPAPNVVEFALFNGAGADRLGNIIGSRSGGIPRQLVPENDTFEFSVTVTGGVFLFDWGNGLVRNFFVDKNAKNAPGQVGIHLGRRLPFLPSMLDSFQITAPVQRDGDLNLDRVVDAIDVDFLTEVINTQEHAALEWFDVNRDSKIDFDDHRFWVRDIKHTWIGDANLDGEFNARDLVTIFQANEYDDGLERNSMWATGDWNGDREFDSRDLVAAFADGGYEVGPRIGSNNVPEPSCAQLLLAAILMRGFALVNCERKNEFDAKSA